MCHTIAPYASRTNSGFMARMASALGLASRASRSHGAATSGHVKNTATSKRPYGNEKLPPLLESRLQRQAQNTPPEIIRNRRAIHAILANGRFSDA